MVICRLAFVSTHVLGAYALGVERINTIFSIPIITDVGYGRAPKIYAMRRDCGVWPVPDGAHLGYRLIGNLLAEFDAQHAVLVVDVAVHASVFELNKRVGSYVAESGEVVSHVVSIPYNS